MNRKDIKFSTILKKGGAVLCILSTLAACGCSNVAENPAEPSANVDPTVSIQETYPTLPQQVIAPVGEYVQQPAVRDWTYLWWRDGFAANRGAGQLNLQTGYYGLALHPAKGQIARLGAIGPEVT